MAGKKIEHFFPVYRNNKGNTWEKKKNLENMKNNYPVSTFELDRASDRKQTYF